MDISASYLIPNFQTCVPPSFLSLRSHPISLHYPSLSFHLFKSLHSKSPPPPPAIILSYLLIYTSIPSALYLSHTPSLSVPLSVTPSVAIPPFPFSLSFSRCGPEPGVYEKPLTIADLSRPLFAMGSSILQFSVHEKELLPLLSVKPSAPTRATTTRNLLTLSLSGQ